MIGSQKWWMIFRKLSFTGVLLLSIGSGLASRASAQTLTCTNSVHCVQISWTASTDAAANPTLGYKVYRLVGVCPATPPATAAAALSAGFAVISGTTPLATLSYIDNGFPLNPLLLGTYCYMATAIVSSAESLPSNDAQAALLPAGVMIQILLK